MPDDKSKTGKPDRGRVSASEPYEVRDLAKKVGLPAPLVKKVIQQEGPMRQNVERYLNRVRSNGRK